MDRPVVVNSLLCFLHNYRKCDDLEILIAKYFSDATQLAAKNVLIELLPDTENGYVASQKLKESPLLALYDRVASFDNCPLFAASDLSSLPLVIIGNNPDSSHALFDEIQQIRFYIQNAISAKEQPREIKKAR